MTVEVKVNGRAGLVALSRALSDEQLGVILEGIGKLLTGRFTKSWRLQASPSGRTWPSRMTPNVPGVVADLNAGGNPKARRFTSGQALVDTGKLRRSITWEVKGSEVTIGTSVTYAPLHNEGGESVITLTDAGRDKLKSWLLSVSRGKKRRRKRLDKLDTQLGFSVDEGARGALAGAIVANVAKDAEANMKLSLGWLFNRPSFKVKVRKRTFIEIGPAEAAVVRKHVEKELRRLTRAGT